MGQDREDRKRGDEMLNFDQKVREQLLQGCKLAKELEEKLRTTPPGKLGDANSLELRFSFAMAAVEAIDIFNYTIKLLISSCCSIGSAPTRSAALQWQQLDRCTVSPRPQKRPFSAMGSPLWTTSWNEETPPISPWGLEATGRPVAKKLTASPSRSNNSPRSETSDGYPTVIRGLELKKEVGQETGDQAAEDDGAGGGKNRSKNARENPISKRKLFPKLKLKMPATNLQQGVEIPPDDGHTWRKYGQKDILGARYPRSYYRCTHKTDLGCQAIKQVQRCDEDASISEVTYRGHHSCRSSQLETKTWPFAFPHTFRSSQISIQHLQESHSSSSIHLPFATALQQQQQQHASINLQAGLLPFNPLPHPNSSSSCSAASSFTLTRSIDSSSLVTPKFGPEMNMDAYIKTDDAFDPTQLLVGLSNNAGGGLCLSNLHNAGGGFDCNVGNIGCVSPRTIDIPREMLQSRSLAGNNNLEGSLEFSEEESQFGAVEQPEADSEGNASMDLISEQALRHGHLPVSVSDWSMLTVRDRLHPATIQHLLQSLATPILASAQCSAQAAASMRQSTYAAPSMAPERSVEKAEAATKQGEVPESISALDAMDLLPDSPLNRYFMDSDLMADNF